MSYSIEVRPVTYFDNTFTNRDGVRGHVVWTHDTGEKTSVWEGAIFGVGQDKRAKASCLNELTYRRTYLTSIGART